MAVGVIKNAGGQILISLRNKHLHQGGLWEFPGGKIEPDETAVQALARELKEELDLTITAIAPLITIKHRYPDLNVQLHVFSVDSYTGTPKSCHCQPFRWVAPEELINYDFPEANQPIITAARLPSYYAIWEDDDPALSLFKLKKILEKDIKLIQARLKTLPPDQIELVLKQAQPLCKEHDAILMLNSAIPRVNQIACAGIHLTSAHLMACEQRPQHTQWIAASCHNLGELLHAQKIGVDFVVLAPVLPTPTHPDADVLGWEKFAGLVDRINLPVYALGGMTSHDLPTAQQAGAQGIAAIRAFLV